LNRSTDRILTTHVGSRVRSPQILRGVKAHVMHKPDDDERFAKDVQTGIQEVVRKQAEIGTDIPSDGEYGRQGFPRLHQRAPERTRPA
jgi:5-methyltetrahydropteroyltriglutamate--homocysteine methyltransferase